MASSLDQVGPLTKTVEDAQIILSAMSGHDVHDSTSVQRDDLQSWEEAITSESVAGLKIAFPEEFLGDGLDPQVKDRILEVTEKLEAAGATIEKVSMTSLLNVVAMYYTIMPAEASTNYARFDGIRFGHQDDTFETENLREYYQQIRSEGFGAEVKRRILLGTHVLSSANYEGYYRKAQKARAFLAQEFAKVFADYDLIIGPTSPEVAWKFGAKSDPLSMYLADIYTIPANLVGVPAISIPVGTVEDQGEQMPVGCQLMANHWREDLLFQAGQVIEKFYT